jgi:hypothetical protein
MYFHRPVNSWKSIVPVLSTTKVHQWQRVTVELTCLYQTCSPWYGRFQY